MINNSSKKVLIVDDSALTRRHLSIILETAGYQLETARNGKECLELLESFQPDAITLDINMPVMDGLTCLKQIMAQRPTAVVMVSSLTRQGAEETFTALELGALDYIAKPSDTLSAEMQRYSELLTSKVATAVDTKVSSILGFSQRMRLNRERTNVATPTTPLPSFIRSQKAQRELIVIGVSTGGPGSLQEIIPQLPSDFSVPIVIAQHMPERFTQVFAERLNSLSRLTVLEVDGCEALRPNHVYIAKGDADAVVEKRGGQLMVKSVKSDAAHLWHPSVSRLVESACEAVNANNLLCIQLTGMGDDGAKEMAQAHSKGAYCIAEAKETCVVYGMPRELVDLKGANAVLPNTKIAEAIRELVKNN